MSFPAFQVAGPIYMLKPLTAGGRRTMMQICASPSPRFRLRSPKIRKKLRLFCRLSVGGISSLKNVTLLHTHRQYTTLPE